MKRFMKKVACFAMAAALIGTSIGYSPATTQAAPKTKKIVMNKKKVTLEVGKTFKLKVKKVTPKKASKAVSYKSNKKKIAKVSKKGKITAVAAGSAKITVTSKKNKKAKATVKVTVTKAGSNTPQGSAAPSAVPTGAVSGTTAPTAAPTGNAATNTPRASRSPRPSAVPSTPTPEPTPPPMDPPSAPYELDLTRDDIIVPQGDATAEKVDGGVKVTVSSQYSGMAFNIPDDVVGKNFDTVTVSYKDPKNTSTGFGCGLWRDPNDKNTESVIAWNGYFPLTDAEGNAAPTSGEAVISLPEGDTTAFYVRKCLFFFNDADSLSANGAAEVVITKIVFSHSQYQGGGDEPTPSNGPTPTEAVPTEEPKNPAVEGKELVVNGDFSDGANKWETNFYLATITATEEGYGLLEGRVNNYSGVKQVLNADYFEKGMIIEYSFKVKLKENYASNPDGQSFAIVFAEDGQEGSWVACKDAEGTAVVGSADDWAVVKGQYTVQKDIRELSFVVAEGPSYIGEGRKGDFYIDDVTMKVAGKAEAPTASPIPTPDLEVAKTDADITVDGDVDEAWATAEAKAVENYSGTKGDTTATAKLLWKADKLYMLVDVKDPAIDATSANPWERDGVEFFLDEDCSKEATYDANTDAFQYRYTGFSAEGAAATTNGVSSQGNSANTLYSGIETAYKIAEGGYVVEAVIPFVTAAVADKYMGFEITVMDCADGKRNNEISLLGAGGRALYNTPSLMGVIKLVDTKAVGPEKDPNAIDLAAANPTVFGQEGAEVTVNEDGSVSYKNDAGFSGIAFDLPKSLAGLKAGDSVNVNVEVSETTARAYLIHDNDIACSNVIGPAEIIEGKLTATADVNKIMIKAPVGGGTVTALTVKKIVLVKVEEGTAPEVSETPSHEPEVYEVDLSSENSYVKDDGAGTVTASYTNDALDVTIANYTGILFAVSESDAVYKYVQVTYTTESENIQAWLFDDKLTDGKGASAPGQHQEADLVKSTEEKTATYQVGAGYSGECLKAIKFVSQSGDKKFKIRSIKFFEADPSAEPDSTKELVVNGDFNDGTTGWEINYPWGSSMEVLTEDDTDNKYLKWSANGQNMMAGVMQKISGDFKVGDTIEISCDIKDAAESQESKYAIRISNGNYDTELAFESPDVTSSSTEWKTITTSYVIKEDTDQLIVAILKQKGWEVSCDYCIDNVSVKQIKA